MKFFKCGKIAENKAFEFLLSLEDKDPFSFVTFDFSFRTKGDHAGLQTYVRLWKFVYEFSVYDVRHWNNRTNQFYLPGEEEAEREAKKHCFHDECEEEDEDII